MARAPRRLLAGYGYHVLNRGNGRMTLFHAPADYRAFLEVLAEAHERCPLQVLAICLMPNHFHFVLKPACNADLTRFMHWAMTTHAVRYHKVHGTVGRLWQNRFKALPVEQDGHLLGLMRYVERNALRSGLVAAAEHWPWGSLQWRILGASPIPLADPPGGLPQDWRNWVNEPQSAAELERLRSCVSG